MKVEQLNRGNEISYDLKILEGKILDLDNLKRALNDGAVGTSICMKTNSGMTGIRIKESLVDGLSNEITAILRKKITAKIEKLNREFKSL